MNLEQQKTIGCIGMTHLGIVHAVAFAEKGFSLVCYDNDAALIDLLQKGEPPVNEPQLCELIVKNVTRLQFTTDAKQLSQCDVVFIAYDVPTDEYGNSDLSVIHHLIKEALTILSPQATLVLLSQVPPGFTRQINYPKAQLFYQVETLVFGNAVERALYPERYIVGTQKDANTPLPEAYETLLSSFNCPVLKMSYESAELAKISINMFLVASVTTTNVLAEICENTGADWGDIVPTLRLDKRIGQYAYLVPGLGIAGGNLERDLNTIIKLGQKYKADTNVVSAWLNNSQYRRDWVLRCLQNHVFKYQSNPKICILGLAYKPNTHSIKNSPSIALIKQLKDYPIHTHDPIVALPHQSNVQQHPDIQEALKNSDVVILMLPSDEYKNLTIDRLLIHMRGQTIIDPHRLLAPKPEHTAIQYFCLGREATDTKQEEINYA